MAHNKEYIENGLLIQEIDARHLETGLLRAAECIDKQQPFIILLTHYDELLATQHSLDYKLLSKLMGIPIGLIEDKEKVLAQNHFFRPVSVDDYEGFVHGALQETLHHAPNDTGHSLADRIDKVLTNRWFGFPILIAVLYGVFELTFAVGSYPEAWIENGVSALCAWLSEVLPAGWLTSLFVDGLVTGIGEILSFVPNILILFILL